VDALRGEATKAAAEKDAAEKAAAEVGRRLEEAEAALRALREEVRRAGPLHAILPPFTHSHSFTQEVYRAGRGGKGRERGYRRRWCVGSAWWMVCRIGVVDGV
jgi:predicted phage gp36 major capsid-like protein